MSNCCILALDHVPNTSLEDMQVPDQSCLEGRGCVQSPDGKKKRQIPRSQDCTSSRYPGPAEGAVGLLSEAVRPRSIRELHPMRQSTFQNVNRKRLYEPLPPSYQSDGVVGRVSMGAKKPINRSRRWPLAKVRGGSRLKFLLVNPQSRRHSRLGMYSVGSGFVLEAEVSRAVSTIEGGFCGCVEFMVVLG